MGRLSIILCYFLLLYCNVNSSSRISSTEFTTTERIPMSFKEVKTTKGDVIVSNEYLTNEITETTSSMCIPNDIRTNYQWTKVTDTIFENATFRVFTKSTKMEQNRFEKVYNTILYIQDTYFIPFFCPVGIIGNCLVAHNLFSRRRVNSSFIYMGFILLADILSLVSDLFLPISRLLQLSDSERIYATAAIMYFWNADIISFLFRRFSLNIFCVLSYERLLAITKPLKLYKSVTVTHSYVFIIMSFMFASLATVVTPLFVKMKPMYDLASNTTTYVHGHTELYANNQEILGKVMIAARVFDGPLQILFFIVVNSLLIYGLYKNKSSEALKNNEDRTKTISNLQVRLCKIFLILSFTNILAFLPSSVFIIVIKIFPETGLTIRSYITRLTVFGGNILRIINSITDFVMFLVISKDIRKDVKAKLCCRRKKRNNSYTDSTYSLNTVEDRCSSISRTG